MKSKMICRIAEVKADDQVTLEDKQDGKKVNVDSNAFLRAVKSSEYQLTSVSSQTTRVVTEWATSANPMLTHDWRAIVKTAEAFLELDKIATTTHA